MLKKVIVCYSLCVSNYHLCYNVVYDKLSLLQYRVYQTITFATSCVSNYHNWYIMCIKLSLFLHLVHQAIAFATSCVPKHHFYYVLYIKISLLLHRVYSPLWNTHFPRYRNKTNIEFYSFFKFSEGYSSICYYAPLPNDICYFIIITIQNKSLFQTFPGHPAYFAYTKSGYEIWNAKQGHVSWMK